MLGWITKWILGGSKIIGVPHLKPVANRALWEELFNLTKIKM